MFPWCELIEGEGVEVLKTRRKGHQVVLSDYDDLEMLDELKASLDEALVSTDLARVHDVGHTFGASVDPLLEPYVPPSLLRRSDMRFAHGANDSFFFPSSSSLRMAEFLAESVTMSFS